MCAHPAANIAANDSSQKQPFANSEIGEIGEIGERNRSM